MLINILTAISHLKNLKRNAIMSLRHQSFIKKVCLNGAIGKNNILNCNAIIQEGSSIIIGNYCNLSCNFVCESNTARIHIGDRVYIGNASLISAASIIIEDDVMLAWGITVMDHNSHSLRFAERVNDQYWLRQGPAKDWSVVDKSPIKIGARSWIGFNSIILKGIEIGCNSIVGSGSVVTKSVPPFCIVAGNPAKIVGQVPIN